MNYDRNSQLIQPYYVIEESNKLAGGEAIISTRCWPTPDGLRSTAISASRAVVDVRQHGIDGFLARPPSAPRSPPRRLVIDYDGDSTDPHETWGVETVTTTTCP